MTFWDWAHAHWFVFAFLATFVAGPITMLTVFCGVGVAEMFFKAISQQRKPNEKLPDSSSEARTVAPDANDNPRH